MEILLLIMVFGLGGLVTTVLLFTTQSKQQFNRPSGVDKDAFFQRVQSNTRRLR